MKRAAVIVLLTALSALNFCSVFFPELSRRYFPLPIKSQKLRKVIHLFSGTVLVLGALLLLYAGFVPIVPEEGTPE